MLIYDSACPDNFRAMVRNAIGPIRTNPHLIRLPVDVRQGLSHVLDGDATYPCSIPSRSVMIGYDGKQYSGLGPSAYTAGACIWICRRTFDEGQARVNAVLLHELIHVLCGAELDSEVFENMMFHGAGATLPDPNDIRTFALKNWTGRWVRILKRGNDVVVRDPMGGDYQIPADWVAALTAQGALQGIPTV